MDTSLLEMKTTNRNEEEENNATVVTFCFQEMMHQEERKGKEQCVRKGTHLFFKLNTSGAFTGQGVASNL